MEIFLTAIRKKYRFATTTGLMTVEDLWDLPLSSANHRVSLDTIAKDINRQLKSTEEESFVENTNSAATVELRTKLEILKFVIATKQTENAEAKKASENRARNAKILEIIERKENKNFEELDIEELKKMVSTGG